MSSPKNKDYENGKIRKNSLTTIYMKSKCKLYGTLRKECSCDDNLFPLGKIIVDFKKLEKA